MRVPVHSAAAGFFAAGGRAALGLGYGRVSPHERQVNPADKRLTELLDKWLTSLELHLKYSALDEASYWKVQPWVKHDRPSRWIIELARQKALQLKEQLDGRVAMGDAIFSDALELMGFLTNLVGSQHIARFIPLAEPQNEVDLKSAAVSAASTASASSASIPIGDSTRLAALTTRPRAALGEATREMPRAAPPREAQRPLDATREMPRAASPRASGRHETRRGGARREGRSGQSARAEARATDPEKENKVVADAVRLLGWGRQWHELAELISRMADRPPLSEVRRILRERKETIETQSASG